MTSTVIFKYLIVLVLETRLERVCSTCLSFLLVYVEASTPKGLLLNVK